MKNTTISISDLITKLQDIEKETPNIKCIINDHELGIENFDFKIKRLYENEDNKSLDIVGENSKKSYLEDIENYSPENRHKIWKEIQEEERKDPDGPSYYKTYKEFEDKCDLIVSNAQEEIMKYKNSTKYLVIQAK